MTYAANLIASPVVRNGAGKPLFDVQSSADHRGVAIDRVGVKQLKYPVTIERQDGSLANSVATINMYVSLPHQVRGTHMSRFLETLKAQAGPLSPPRILAILTEMRERLTADDAYLEVDFDYFIEKPAPVTGATAPMVYQAMVRAFSGAGDDLKLGVRVPATSLCPCSKAISRYGAHNQRCEIEAWVRSDGAVWFDDLIGFCEQAASAPLFSVLKRPDEKHVTEQAYENPKFVEDIVRDLAVILRDDPRVDWFSVSSENFESIHAHNAYASIEWDKQAEPEA